MLQLIICHFSHSWKEETIPYRFKADVHFNNIGHSGNQGQIIWLMKFVIYVFSSSLETGILKIDFSSMCHLDKFSKPHLHWMLVVESMEESVET